MAGAETTLTVVGGNETPTHSICWYHRLGIPISLISRSWHLSSNSGHGSIWHWVLSALTHWVPCVNFQKNPRNLWKITTNPLYGYHWYLKKLIGLLQDIQTVAEVTLILFLVCSYTTLPSSSPYRKPVFEQTSTISVFGIFRIVQTLNNRYFHFIHATKWKNAKKLWRPLSTLVNWASPAWPFQHKS